MAVGMQSALDSAIGLPRRSTNASWMLVFLMPAEVSRNFMMPLLAILMKAERLLQLELQDSQSFPKEKIPFLVRNSFFAMSAAQLVIRDPQGH
jgi:hypothetical protein